MYKRVFFVVLFAGLFVAIAIAQPSPIEYKSYNGDTLTAIHGPKGKVLRDGCPVFVIRSTDSTQGIPKAGTGLAETESIIMKTAINEMHEFPGELYFYLTAAEKNEFWVPSQAVRGEKIFFRVFDTVDSTFASGTPYANTDILITPSVPSSVPNIHFGAWKKIP